MYISHDNQIVLKDGSRFFYVKEFQLINATGMMYLENHHFTNLNEITYSGKCH